jgi:ribosomal protein S3
MSYSEEAVWLNIRSEAHNFMKEREERVIKQWLNEIGYIELIGYYRNSWKREVEIYATKPGVLIGKAGTNIEKFKHMLIEEFGGTWAVKLIEIRGGFISIGED